MVEIHQRIVDCNDIEHWLKTNDPVNGMIKERFNNLPGNFTARFQYSPFGYVYMALTVYAFENVICYWTEDILIFRFHKPFVYCNYVKAR